MDPRGKQSGICVTPYSTKVTVVLGFWLAGFTIWAAAPLAFKAWERYAPKVWNRLRLGRWKDSL